MSDPKVEKVSAKDATLSMMAVGMVEGGMSSAEAEKRAAEKLRDTTVWMRWAGFYAFVTMAIACVALWRIVLMVEAGKSVIVISIVAGGVASFPAALAMYCGTQASGEVMRTFLGFLTGTVSRFRGKKD